MVVWRTWVAWWVWVLAWRGVVGAGVVGGGVAYMAGVVVVVEVDCGGYGIDGCSGC